MGLEGIGAALRGLLILMGMIAALIVLGVAAYFWIRSRGAMRGF